MHTQQSGIICKKSLILVTASKKDSPLPRFGFTVSKKIGSAVVRNKIKRRLKSIVRDCCDATATSQKPASNIAEAKFDFVLIATRQTAGCNFLYLRNQVKEAIEFIVHK